MTDIHTHIIPLVDDGSSSIEESIKLLQMEIKNGVDKVICTPHQRKGFLNKEEIINIFFKLKEKVSNLPIELYLGAEVLYYDNIINDLKDNKILTMNNSNYFLLEFPTTLEFDIPSIVYEIITSGYIPIIAHIERYDYLKYEDYAIIKKYGGLISINSSSFRGLFTSKKCKYLLRNGMCDFVASDCHDSKSRLVRFKGAKRFIKYHLKYRKFYDNLFNHIPVFLND